MLTKLKRSLAGLAILATALVVAPNTAGAASAGPYLIVVHVADGSHSDDNAAGPPGAPKTVSLPEVIWPEGRDGKHVVNYVFTIGEGVQGFSVDSQAGGGGDRQPEQVWGDIAAGLMFANRRCDYVLEELGRSHTSCQVILVNYRLPESQTHRRMAAVTAEALAADGHSLHTIAITADGADATTGPEADLLQFNRQLTRWAAIVTDDADYAVGFSLMLDWIGDFVEGGPGLLPPDTWPVNWGELSSRQQVRFNPYKCDTALQWILSSDGSCRDKAPELILPADWDQLSPADKVRANPYGCNTAVEWIWASDGTCHYKDPELVLPADWDELDYAERRQLNPYGCADHQWLRYWDGICDQIPYPIGRGGGS